MKVKFEKILEQIKSYSIIFIGTLLVAIGLDLFLIPNKITAGGVSGLSTVLHYLFNVPVGGTMLFFNVILFILAFLLLGKDFGVKSIFATIVLSLQIDGLVYLWSFLGFNMEIVKRGITSDLLLATIFGDIFTGIGMALVLIQNASTGGTDIVARILNRFKGIPFGRSLLLVDALVTIFAGLVFGPELAMYAIIAIFVNSNVIDFVIQGMNQGKKFLIISDKSEEIAKAVLYEMDRGATFLKGVGAYSGEERKILLVAIRNRELVRLRDIVKRIDPDAFVLVSTIYEVMGKGFKRFE